MKNGKPRSKTRQVQISTQLRKGSEKQTSWDVKMFAKFKMKILFASSVTLNNKNAVLKLTVTKIYN